MLCRTPSSQGERFLGALERTGEEVRRQGQRRASPATGSLLICLKQRGGAFINAPKPVFKMQVLLPLGAPDNVEVQRHPEHCKQSFLTWASGFGPGGRQSLNPLKIQAKCSSCEHMCSFLGMFQPSSHKGICKKRLLVLPSFPREWLFLYFCCRSLFQGYSLFCS